MYYIKNKLFIKLKGIMLKEVYNNKKLYISYLKA
jgi:hypothetical protein